MFGIVIGPDVYSAVWGQLSGVNENPGPDAVSLPRQAVNWLDESRDIRRPAHGQERDAISVLREQPVHVVLVEPPFARNLRSNHMSAPPPRQIVRVVLHHCRKNHTVPAQRVTERELVEGFSSVLPEDGRVGVHIGSDETSYYLVRLIICGGADA